MQINEIFYIDKYDEAYNFVIENSLIITEIEANEKGRRFKIVDVPQPTQKELLFDEISQIKENLKKWKEDVEQVELFGMERADYEEKKLACKNAIERLRELENIVNKF